MTHLLSQAGFFYCRDGIATADDGDAALGIEVMVRAIVMVR